jgi:excisionase family DNA binding protein
MVLRGDLPLVRAGRRILIDRQDLDLWIERNKESG